MGFLDPNSWANAFDTSAEDSAEDALKFQQSAEDRRATLAEDQFKYQKSLAAPFFQGSLPSYHQYVASITGQNQSYDPYATKEGYTRLSPEEARNLNRGYEYTTQIEHGKPHGYMKNSQTGEMIKLSNNTPTAESWFNAGQPGAGSQGLRGLVAGLQGKPTDATASTPYGSIDPNKTYYRDPNGNLVEGKMETATPFKPTETEGYKWQQQQMDKNTSRYLRSLGRANSTFGMNAIGDQNRTLAASEYDKQLGRLADLTNIAMGGASSLTGASSGFSNQQQQGLTNMGNNAANASLAGGMMRQNSLYNGQQNGMALANLGLKTYDYGKGQGWWGGGESLSGAGNSYGVMASDANTSDWGSGDWFGGN